MQRNQLVHLPTEFDQNVQPSFMCEKHGKGPDDAVIFGPVRRWLDQHLLLPEAFLEDETQRHRALQQQAGLEMMQNPDGTKFIIETFAPGDKPRTFS